MNTETVVHIPNTWLSVGKEGKTRIVFLLLSSHTNVKMTIRFSNWVIIKWFEVRHATNFLTKNNVLVTKKETYCKYQLKWNQCSKIPAGKGLGGSLPPGLTRWRPVKTGGVFCSLFDKIYSPIFELWRMLAYWTLMPFEEVKFYFS